MKDAYGITVNRFISTTTNETNLIHWAEIDGCTYGIYDTFEVATLMYDDGTKCDDSISVAYGDKLVEGIKQLQKKEDDDE